MQISLSVGPVGLGVLPVISLGKVQLGVGRTF